MEPVQIGRGDSGTASAAMLSVAVTPQWSPSRSDGVTWGAVSAEMGDDGPQWSPSRSDGVTFDPISDHNPLMVTAMEPVQIGRGDARPTRRAGCSAACRNGARPDRTG